MELSIELLERARTDDLTARESLSSWCLQRAFRLAYVDLGETPNRPQVAQEIAGEASLRALSSLHQLGSDARFDAWFHQIVRNCVRQHFARDTDRGFPPAVYQRWVHDFLRAYGPEIEALIRNELGQEPSIPHPVLMQRIAGDLGSSTYRQFQRLSYDGRADAVLTAVKRWLRAFVGQDEISLYETDSDGEWIEAGLVAEEETEAQVLQHEFIQQVNERLASLEPFCRRLIRWYYLDHLRIPEIARLENLHERTTYRRLENCAASFRARLMRDGYFAEFAAGRDGAATGRRRGGR